MAAQSISMARILHLEPQGYTNDLELAQRAQDGDEHAFNRVFKENLSRVYAICLRMVKKREKAEELSLESMARAWEMLDQYRAESPLSAWIRSIAVNVVLDHLRLRKTWLKRLEFSDDLESLEKPSLSASPDLKLDLEDGISALPTKARAVIVLHDIEGYSHREISELMGIAIGTSKAHLHAARRMLKEVLQR